MDVLETIREQVRRCEAAGVEILCCPEAVLGGLADYHERPAENALTIRDGQLECALSPLASDGVATIVGFTELGDDGALYNSAAVYERGRVAGVHRKLQPAINRSVYRAGHELPVFTVGGLTFGILICRDSTFAEAARILASKGATALFVPTNNGLPPRERAPRSSLRRAAATSRAPWRTESPSLPTTSRRDILAPPISRPVAGF